MRKQLTTVSMVVNVLLIAGLIWMYSNSEAHTREVGLAAMRGDEIHLRIHARSLASLESDDLELVESTVEVLRKVIAAGEADIEARRRAGLGP